MKTYKHIFVYYKHYSYQYDKYYRRTTHTSRENIYHVKKENESENRQEEEKRRRRYIFNVQVH